MFHDPQLIERLGDFPTASFAGDVFRATPQGLDALTRSRSGGRWATTDQFPVLYTSMEREGALAEVVFHWSQMTPIPSKPLALHRIRMTVSRHLRLIETDLYDLGVELSEYQTLNYARTQQIGAAVNFLECDGLIVPSARWDCENMVLFMDNFDLAHDLEVLGTEPFEWRTWARKNGFLGEPSKD